MQMDEPTPDAKWNLEEFRTGRSRPSDISDMTSLHEQIHPLDAKAVPIPTCRAAPHDYQIKCVVVEKTQK